MTDSTATLAADLDDLVARARDLGLPTVTNLLVAARSACQEPPRTQERPSSPNYEARETATGRFRAARAILREAKLI